MKILTLGFAFLATTIGALSLAIIPADAQETRAPSARFIVKFRDSPSKAAVSKDARIAKLATATGSSLRRLRDMGLGAEVLVADHVDDEASAESLAARLRANTDVEYAAVDRLRHPMETAPVNDRYVGSQFYLFDGPTGINAFDAWTVTHGSPETVVAVIDTGYRPHIGMSGRFLPGYDMISEPAVANDGDGRDPDASDPGDWLQSDMLTGIFADCDATTSSWHGTSVSGVIAANTDDGGWTAGIDWNAKILPVRVLGRCGGYDSDIIDAMLWAAGVSVPSVPDNPHPAQVLNLSLGGSGACPDFYSYAIAQAYEHGIVRAIVVAAGNDGADVSNDTPASCPGVIAVASSTTTGNLAAYSNFGSGVALSAPGGSVNTSFSDQVIVVLSNKGTAGPVEDSIAYEGGTSFSAPMVSGAISLMLAVNPNLAFDSIVSILKATASPFLATSDCTIARCGAGILNAAEAVRAAVTASAANHEGLWWASPAESESGWGLNIAHQGSIMFATWFTYDTQGSAWWLSMTATPVSPNVYEGTLTETHGPPFSAVPFDPASVTRTPVGEGELTFTGNGTGYFTYTVNGVTQSKPIVVEAFGLVPVCTWGGLPDLAAATNYQDIWWASPAESESGWGINLAHQGDAIFGTWFTYDQNGDPLWLSVTATTSANTGSRIFSGGLIRTSGPAFSATPFDPALVTRSIVGVADFAFSDGANGTFTYTVNGIGAPSIKQSKPFTREIFVPPGTVCQ